MQIIDVYEHIAMTLFDMRLDVDEIMNVLENVYEIKSLLEQSIVINHMHLIELDTKLEMVVRWESEADMYEAYWENKLGGDY